MSVFIVDKGLEDHTLKTGKRLTAAVILCASLFQMGMVGLAPVIAAIQDAFPGSSNVMVQLASTFLNLVLVITALFSGPISRMLGRRGMVAGGMALFTVSGLGGWLFTPGLWAVYLWSGLLGLGTGLFVPAVSSAMVDYFDRDERSVIAGYQTAAVNVGGVLLSVFTGILAAQVWNRAYLVFVLSFPVVLLALIGMPGDKVPGAGGTGENKAGNRIHSGIWFASIQTAVFAVSYFTFSTNISLLLDEMGNSSTSLAGILTGCFMLGGCLCGLFFGKLYSWLRSYTAVFAFGLVSASYAVIYTFHGIAPLVFAALFGGGSLSVIFPFLLVTEGGPLCIGYFYLSDRVRWSESRLLYITNHRDEPFIGTGVSYGERKVFDCLDPCRCIGCNSCDI